jgi:serine/threonine-protein kinase HipA
LSPAYDLTPTPHVSIERRDLAMICGDQGRYANAENLKSQSARFLLKPDEADSIIDRMEAQVKDTWYAVMRAEGMSEGDCERLKGAFAYPGFRFRQAA